nr:immunoglobulin heavy chain junction region [Mus musculus]
CARYTSGFAYW